MDRSNKINQQKMKQRSTTRFKVIGDEVMYKTDTPLLTKKVASRSRNPAILKKSYLRKVVKKMQDKKKNVVKTNQHKLIRDYSVCGEVALQKCTCASLDVVMNNFSPISVHKCTPETMFLRIRSAILDHNWSHCLDLYVRLLHLKGLSKRHAMFVLRVIIIALLNSRVGGDELEKFLRVTFGFSNEQARLKFLRSLFILPKKLQKPRTKKAPRSGKESEEGSASEPDNPSSVEDCSEAAEEESVSESDDQSAIEDE